MGQSDVLLDVLQETYGAAVDPSRWAFALGKLGSALGGMGTVVEIHNKATGELGSLDSGLMGPTASKRYEDRFFRLNPRVRYSSRAPESAIFHDNSIGAAEVLNLDPYYNEFLAPAGLRYFLSANLVQTPDMRITAAVQRTRRQGHVGDPEIAVMTALLPHLQQAIQLHLTFMQALAHADSLGAALSDTPTAIFLLSRSGDVRFANDAGIALKNVPDLFEHASRQLVLKNVSHRAAFNRALQNALQTTDGVIGQSAQALKIARENGTHLTIRVAPVTMPETPLALVAKDVAIMVTITGNQNPTTATLQDVAQAMFGLTPREASLAVGLATGLSTANLAEKHAISINTVRWHLASVRDKLGVRSQKDIVRTILALPTS